jgi:hypothetical protein
VQKWILIGGGVAVAGAAAYFLMKPSPEEQLQAQWGMLEKYCVDCHNDAELTANLSFEGRRPDNVHSDPAVWEEVLRKLKIHAMPPRQEPQPAHEMVEQFVAGLEGTLDAAAAAECARLAAASVDPPDDFIASAAYRRHATGVLTRRLLERAFGV